MAIVFKAPARLDASDVEKLRADFERLANSVGDVVVDLARTELVDGSGVGALVFAFKRLAAKGNLLTVRNVSGQPLDLLNESGLLQTLGGERPEGMLRAVIRHLRRHRLPAARDVVSVEVETMPAERTKGAA